MLDRILASLPRPLLVGLVLVVALVVIIVSNPPFTVCKSQFETLKKSQEGFIYPRADIKFKTRSGFQKATEVCKYGNSPGACLDLFNGLKKLAKDLEAMPQECGPEISGEAAVEKTIRSGLSLMVGLAWSEKPPLSWNERQGWLDNYHVGIFCTLKKAFVDILGEDAWMEFREKEMQNLPGAKGLSRKDQWERSLFSVPCEKVNY